MSKDWSYAMLSKNAKAGGGPVQYINTIKKRSFQNGALSMLPLCVTIGYISYTSGDQIVNFFKTHFGIITKEDANIAEKQIVSMNENITIECPVCQKEAHGIDEINTLFGFSKNLTGNIYPNRICKQCQLDS